MGGGGHKNWGLVGGGAVGEKTSGGGGWGGGGGGTQNSGCVVGRTCREETTLGGRMQI